MTVTSHSEGGFALTTETLVGVMITDISIRVLDMDSSALSSWIRLTRESAQVVGVYLLDSMNAAVDASFGSTYVQERCTAHSSKQVTY